MGLAGLSTSVHLERFAARAAARLCQQPIRKKSISKKILSDEKMRGRIFNDSLCVQVKIDETRDSWLGAGLPDLSWYNMHTNTGKNIPNYHKILPNVH
jgi:hypothetical protein